MGTVYAVGIGPGDRKYYTQEAAEVIAGADLVVGYRVYTDLVREHFPDKAYYSTSMRGERERCRKALEEAASGKNVAVVCSGDAGVYGMAGLLYELSEDYPGTEILVVPGVTAALTGAALLGAPLSNDFCTVSLSDVLTPWEQIEKRLRAAGQGDFVVCLYNPASKNRPDHLQRACRILMEYRSPDTVCGYVRNIGRAGEEKRILSLKELAETNVDMFTTVFIGNQSTALTGGRMVTRRGYDHGI
ncbi:MAG: precorrin-3B C(17)-methyltransferase [Lachnospiraceae bacterium]|nr:precorrin-3B C(17)-methyltransferase [Lachnospiraceae bacterium]